MCRYACMMLGVLILILFLVPSGVPEIVSAVRTSPDTLEVEYTPLAKDNNIGHDITSYTIVYAPNVNNADCFEVFAGRTSTVSVSADVTTVEIDKLDANREYCVAVAARSEGGTGNFSQVLLVNGKCFHIILKLSGCVSLQLFCFIHVHT